MQHSHHFHGQMSDTFRAAVFVTLSGGFQDAYTYISRGQVFANAQTGNIVLLSAALLRGDWAVCLKYLIPILSFVLGTMAAEFIHIRFRNFRQLHWRQLVLLQEIVFLCAAMSMPVPCASAISAVRRRRWANICAAITAHRSTRQRPISASFSSSPQAQASAVS